MKLPAKPCRAAPRPLPAPRARGATLALLVLALAWTTTHPEPAHAAPAWADALRQQVERIEQATPGQLGLYVKRLDNGETFAHAADRPWYLASSVKLPVAIAVLQEAEAGRLRLDQQLVVQARDKVDGSGAVVWQPEGTRHSVQSLLQRMLMESDNTAANMLIRAVGEDTLNQRAQALLGGRGVGRITNFTEVRYQVYAEAHPDARRLSNMDLVRIAGAPVGPKRLQALARTLGVAPSALRVQTLDEAYDRYYRTNHNTATLEGYGAMLEKLVRGQLVSPAHQQLLYKDLKFDTYDAYRLEAGLPRTVRFIHKTGTQLHRACHMGVIDPQDNGRNAIVVAACAEGLDEMKEAGKAFEQVGRAITQTMLQDRIPAKGRGTPAGPQAGSRPPV
ncbi:serine hydrolase [Acidovorax sp. SUPP950]|uniref:serine hydrolase n=1 Tax=Acidovorax sp. SUPP950 TaxID=511901 RepID=UPI0023CEB74B|nr:serine hydrolase [Acidovorax sp. SUPP950]GKS76093.1 serine hydrolase [Acidovorax sp. SUPP950]